MDYCFFACRLAEFFAAVLKTEQRGGWLLIGIALRRGAERPITIKQSAFLRGQFSTWHHEDRRMNVSRDPAEWLLF